MQGVSGRDKFGELFIVILKVFIYIFVFRLSTLWSLTQDNRDASVSNDHLIVFIISWGCKVGQVATTQYISLSLWSRWSLKMNIKWENDYSIVSNWQYIYTKGITDFYYWYHKYNSALLVILALQLQ